MGLSTHTTTLGLSAVNLWHFSEARAETPAPTFTQGGIEALDHVLRAVLHTTMDLSVHKTDLYVPS